MRQRTIARTGDKNSLEGPQTHQRLRPNVGSAGQSLDEEPENPRGVLEGCRHSIPAPCFRPED